MRKYLQGILAAVALVALIGSAGAQTSVQQSATMANSATGLYGPAGGATTCATVNTTAANGTVTITPPAGKYVYITSIGIDITANTTGLTGVATMSTTNLTGGPFWSLATIIPTAGANGTFRQISETYPTGLKSTAPGTAVTFVPSAQSNNVIFCTRVAAFFAD